MTSIWARIQSKAKRGVDLIDQPERVVKAAAPQPTLAIVYQFGKVASTSLVASLNKIDNVDAKHSHFLGRSALRDALQNLTKPGVPEYFFHHQVGQLYENILLTRRLMEVQSDQSSERLLVISVAREPLSWLASVIMQDIEGNIVRLQEFLKTRGNHQRTDGDTVRIGLVEILRVFSEIIEENDGIDKIIAGLPTNASSLFGASNIKDHEGSKILFYTMLRPFHWFQKLFEPIFNIEIDEMKYKSDRLSYSNDVGDYFILKYENIDDGYTNSLKELGYEYIPALERLNISASKRLAAEVRSAFCTPEAARLDAHFRNTKYSNKFGYTKENLQIERWRLTKC